MDRELSILFGLSGVGKTTMGRRVRDLDPGIAHLSASDLLKAAHSQSGEELRTAQQDRLIANQLVLGDALTSWDFPLGTHHILLDAHSVVDNDRVLVDIPVEVIASLSPDRLIFIREEPEIIVERRLSDTRSRPSRTAKELQDHQERSLAVCNTFSHFLNIPLSVIKSGDLTEFRSVLGLETPPQRDLTSAG